MPTSPRPGRVAKPHDSLVKFVFSQREHAVGLLKTLLPAEVAAAFDWASLKLETGSSVDRALRHRHSDLLFSGLLGGQKTYFYTVVEPQHDVEALMILRGGIYMMRLWEHLVRDQRKLRKIPPILLLVIHHGPSRWTAATSFEDVVEVAEPMRAALLPYTPRFQMMLVELTPERMNELLNETMTALGKVALWCLSVAGSDARFKQEIGRIAEALDEVLARKDAGAALSALLRYLLTTHPRVSAPKIAKLLETTADLGKKETMRDVLDVFRKEGRVEGRAQTLLEQLAARFGSVPDAVKSRITTAKKAELSRWSIRVLTEPTLEDVLKAPTRKGAKASRPAARK